MTDSVRMKLDEFLAIYNPDDCHELIEIDLDQAVPSRFVLVRHGDYAAVLSLMPLHDHLCVDVHAFVGGEDAASGVFGMTDGQRHTFHDTDETSHGWNATRLVAVLVGEQRSS